MIPNRFVILWDDQPVGLEKESGGYPFKTEKPSLIKWWRTKEEAKDYIAIFQKYDSTLQYQRMKVVEIQFRLTER